MVKMFYTATIGSALNLLNGAAVVHSMQHVVSGSFSPNWILGHPCTFSGHAYLGLPSSLLASSPLTLLYVASHVSLPLDLQAPQNQLA